MLEIFARGLLFGLAIAAPVGPIGLLCIRRTLSDGRLAGLASGLGAATADGIYGLIAALGLSAASAGLVAAGPWLKLAGGLFLIYLGVTTARAAPTERPAAADARGLLGAYLSTLALTLTSPLTILSFTVIFAGLGVGVGVGLGGGLALVAGVTAGSALWWTLLSGGVSLLRARVTPRLLRAVNLGAGLLIAAFGVGALLA